MVKIDVGMVVVFVGVVDIVMGDFDVDFGGLEVVVVFDFDDVVGVGVFVDGEIDIYGCDWREEFSDWEVKGGCLRCR